MKKILTLAALGLAFGACRQAGAPAPTIEEKANAKAAGLMNAPVAPAPAAAAETEADAGSRAEPAAPAEPPSAEPPSGAKAEPPSGEQ